MQRALTVLDSRGMPIRVGDWIAVVDTDIPKPERRGVVLRLWPVFGPAALGPRVVYQPHGKTWELVVHAADVKHDRGQLRREAQRNTEEAPRRAWRKDVRSAAALVKRRARRRAAHAVWRAAYLEQRGPLPPRPPNLKMREKLAAAERRRALHRLATQPCGPAEAAWRAYVASTRTVA